MVRAIKGFRIVEQKVNDGHDDGLLATKGEASRNYLAR